MTSPTPSSSSYALRLGSGSGPGSRSTASERVSSSSSSSTLGRGGGGSGGSTLDVYRPDVLQGKVALITGGGSGICRGMTEALMRHGCDTIIVSRTQSKLDEAARDLEQRTGKKCFPVAADVRDPEALRLAVQKALDRYHGQLDILVCGAAGNFLAPVDQLSERAFQTVIAIDLLGTFHTIKACLPALERTAAKQQHRGGGGGGCIINVSATLQYSGIPFQAHAVSAKAGIDAMTRTLAVELGPRRIRINAIAPGPIEGTEGMSRLLPPAFKDTMLSSIPLQAMGTIQDIEMATLHLASPAGRYVTGTVLVVDGGSWMTQTGLYVNLAQLQQKQKEHHQPGTRSPTRRSNAKL